MNVTMHLNLDSFEFELADSQVIDELVSKKKLKVTMLDHYGRLYEGDLAEAFSSDDLTTRDLVPGNLYYDIEDKRLVLPYELLKKMDKHYVHGADVKIMDRLFWHREVPHSENFSKPGFQLKTA